MGKNKGKRILNVGCGSETYGTDFVDLYPERKEVIKCDLEKEKLPFDDEIFDEVYAAYVIEHLRKIGQVLEEMKRVLKKGGKIVIKTDNAGYWGYHAWMRFNSQHYGGYKSHGTEDRHYSLFTPEHLKNHFQDLGLKEIKIEYRQGNSRRIVRTFNNFLYKIGLKRISYPHLHAEAIKK